MQDSFITNNIISQSYKNKHMFNILYKRTNSLIDTVFPSLQNINFFDEQYVSNNNITNLDCILSCNPLEHIPFVNNYKPMHMKNLVYIIYDYPGFLKKEDRFLLKNQLSSTKKLTASEYLKKNWDVFDAQILPYGIPKNTIVKNIDKDILIINLEKNHTINNIYGTIKQSFAKTDILYNLAEHAIIEDVYKLFSSYKIIIDINNIINGLVALEAGCDLLTNKNYLIEDGALVFNDMDQLFNQIKTTLESNTSKENKISEKYDFTIFESKLVEQISQLIAEPFIYE